MTFIKEYHRISITKYSEDGHSLTDGTHIGQLCQWFFGSREPPVLDEACLREREQLDRDKRRKRRQFEAEETRKFLNRLRRLSRSGITRNIPSHHAMPPLYGQSEREWTQDDDAQDRPSKRRRAEKDGATSQGRKSRSHHEKGDGDERHRTDRARTSRPSRGSGAGGSPLNEASYTKQNGPGDDDIFREALFDALSDPEGAEYWERLYGQPIHVYPRPVGVNRETGQREPVTDAEYVAYVRRKMWEKTHEGYMESRKKRMEEQGRRLQEEAEQREAEERRKADDRRRTEARRRVEEDIDRALRRAEKRKQKQTEGLAFADYVTHWNAWDGDQATIPWPTENGSPEGITERGVRSFFLRGLDLQGLGTRAFNAKLKEHRVRWHPDKMEQRMGGRTKVDEATMADITMTFQVIDTLYNDTRQAK